MMLSVRADSSASATCCAIASLLPPDFLDFLSPVLGRSTYEVLGIIDDADLFEPDVEAVFNRYAAMYPQVRVFQVGNEITTSAVSPMPIDRYLDVLERMYVHVVGHYPGR